MAWIDEKVGTSCGRICLSKSCKRTMLLSVSAAWCCRRSAALHRGDECG